MTRIRRRTRYYAIAFVAAVALAVWTVQAAGALSVLAGLYLAYRAFKRRRVPCPACGRPVPGTAKRCRFCGYASAS